MSSNEPTPAPKPEPTPDGKSDPNRRGNDLVGSIVQAERMTQAVFVLPCAGFIGWLIGAWLGKHFHQPWMPVAGVVFGIFSGLIGVIRMAMAVSAGTSSSPSSAPRGKDDPGGQP
jgi:F0F1-type ATP synthase assembly protein I